MILQCPVQRTDRLLSAVVLRGKILAKVFRQQSYARLERAEEVEEPLTGILINRNRIGGLPFEFWLGHEYEIAPVRAAANDSAGLLSRPPEQAVAVILDLSDSVRVVSCCVRRLDEARSLPFHDEAVVDRIGP